jgi:hypothetical protein
LSSPVEVVSGPNGPLAYLVRAGWKPQKTEFVTPNTLGQQLGMIVYPKGGVIQPHLHLPVVREVHGTLETIFVRSGRCELDLYDETKAFIGTRTLETGDVVLLTGGGHGFRMLEDTVLCEVKQGPYVDVKDKERF